MKIIENMKLRITIRKLKKTHAADLKELRDEHASELEHLRKKALDRESRYSEKTTATLEQHKIELLSVRADENKRLTNVIAERDKEIKRHLDHIRDNQVLYADINERGYEIEEALSRTIANIISGELQIKNGTKLIQGSLDEIESMNRKYRKVEHVQQKQLSEK